VSPDEERTEAEIVRDLTDEDVTESDLNNMLCQQCQHGMHTDCDGTTYDRIIDRRVTCICYYLDHQVERKH
jgi:hypothetical protein